MQRHYRADIDGLRALAVLPVVLFHFGVPGMDGGFVGVDVFFVISGFLITSVIERELAAGSFSLVRFYERRARRLLPALFTVMLVCSVVALRLLDLASFRDFALSAGAAALFASNIFFFQQGGYFDAPDQLEPLLHTWSLGVEEQFYLLYPLLLMALRRWLPRRALSAIALLTLLSFGANVVVVDDHASAAFYLLPFRAWELGLGASLALGIVPTFRSRVVHGLLGAVGCLVLLASFATTSSHAPYPGWAALQPCLATCAIIVAGRCAVGPAFALLSSAPAVFVGRISYALYLWHWPVIVLLAYMAPDGVLDARARWTAILASGALAFLSTYFIEHPIRHGGRLSRRQVFTGSAGATLAALVLALVGSTTAGFPQRFPQHVRMLAGSAQPAHEPPCSAWRGRSELCLFGRSGASPTVLLWGDSHAWAALPGIEEAATRADAAGVYAISSGCPPLLGVAKDERKRDAAEDAKCAVHNRAVLEMLRHEPSLERVLLVGRWSYYASGRGIGRDAWHQVTLRTLGDADTAPTPGSSAADALFASEAAQPPPVRGNGVIFRRALRDTLMGLLALGRHPFLMEQPPELAHDTRSLFRRWALGRDAAGAGGALQAHARVPRAQVERRQRVWNAMLAEGLPTGTRVVHTRDIFCDALACPSVLDGRPRYRDNNHITEETSRALQHVYAPVFAQPARASVGR